LKGLSKGILEKNGTQCLEKEKKVLKGLSKLNHEKTFCSQWKGHQMSHMDRKKKGKKSGLRPLFGERSGRLSKVHRASLFPYGQGPTLHGKLSWNEQGK